MYIHVISCSYPKSSHDDVATLVFFFFFKQNDRQHRPPYSISEILIEQSTKANNGYKQSRKTNKSKIVRGLCQYMSLS